jgi:hypothetical protein
MSINAAVERAIEEVRATFPENPIDVTEDGQGGARVRVHDLHLGEQYEPARSWALFAITFQYPEADVYPHFFVPGLKRVGGGALGEGFQETQWNSEAVTQVSRRSNNRNADLDTAAIKLGKVLAWVRTR